MIYTDRPCEACAQTTVQAEGNERGVCAKCDWDNIAHIWAKFRNDRLLARIEKLEQRMDRGE